MKRPDDPNDWISQPRWRFKLAAAYLRIELGIGEAHEKWRRWQEHCNDLGLGDETIARDCIAGMLGLVHNGHGGIHPKLLEYTG